MTWYFYLLCCHDNQMYLRILHLRPCTPGQSSRPPAAAVCEPPPQTSSVPCSCAETHVSPVMVTMVMEMWQFFRVCSAVLTYGTIQ